MPNTTCDNRDAPRGAANYWHFTGNGGIINNVRPDGWHAASGPLTIHHMRDAPMYVCPQCGSTTDPTDATLFTSGRETCGRCSSKLRPQEDRTWIDVARVTNLAEAGFLADELVGSGIDAQVHQQQEFSLLTDGWTSQYLIRVPSDQARDAAAHIREYLADDAEREADRPYYQFTAHAQSMDPMLWRPVALVILAGVSSFVLGQRFSDQNEVKVDRRPQRDSLSSAMSAIDRPFVTTPARGQPAHRLSFDRQRQRWLLETDRDNDGRYDSRQAFQATGAVW
jgi:hypothetical protein